jgi:hypothetical protein
MIDALDRLKIALAHRFYPVSPPGATSLAKC